MEQRKTKVLYVITKSNWGGAQKYVYDLATALPEDQFEVVVALGGTGKRGAAQGALADRLQTAGVRTVFVKNFARDIFLLDDIRAFFELYDLFKDERPDVIHLSSSKAGGLGALAGLLARVPTRIFTAHGLAIHEERPAIVRFLIFLSSWLTFFFATRAIVINALDFETARHWPRVARKITLIRNGIAPPHFLETEVARKKLAEIVGQPELVRIPLWIGTISELHPNKGIEYMLGACRKLRDAEQEFVYFLAGADGGDQSRLTGHIKELGIKNSVILAGPILDAAQYLKAFDIFVLASLKEGLPYVLLEAALAERAIVATNVGGIPEIVDEKSGILVPSKSADALAEAITTLLASPDTVRTYGKNARVRAEQTFSQNRMREATILLYQSNV